MEELNKFNNNAEVRRIYGSMSINIPNHTVQKRYLTQGLIGIIEDANKNCLLMFEDL